VSSSSSLSSLSLSSSSLSLSLSCVIVVVCHCRHSPSPPLPVAAAACRRRPTHDPPHEQLLVRLGGGCVSFLVRRRSHPCCYPPCEQRLATVVWRCCRRCRLVVIAVLEPKSRIKTLVS
jgi:hypothetical protein